MISLLSRVGARSFRPSASLSLSPTIEPDLLIFGKEVTLVTDFIGLVTAELAEVLLPQVALLDWQAVLSLNHSRLE